MALLPDKNLLFILKKTTWNVSSSPTCTLCTMSPTRVGVIGAGIAGPILAIFLKAKGYDPIVCERTEAMVDSGVGHGYVECILWSIPAD
jgi:hypothetical protein